MKKILLSSSLLAVLMVGASALTVTNTQNTADIFPSGSAIIVQAQTRFTTPNATIGPNGNTISSSVNETFSVGTPFSLRVSTSTPSAGKTTATFNPGSDTLSLSNLVQPNRYVLEALSPSGGTSTSTLSGITVTIGSNSPIVLSDLFSNGNRPFDGYLFDLNSTEITESFVVSETQNIGGSNGSGAIFKEVGITVPQTVPEPSTWVLMIGGFGLLVAYQRRRRTAVVTVR